MLSLVSSGFYLLARFCRMFLCGLTPLSEYWSVILIVSCRNYDIWYLICKKIFRVPCPNVVRDVDWRLMFMTIPHLYFHGVYIGKCSYVRYGEASFQVPWRTSWYLLIIKTFKSLPAVSSYSWFNCFFSATLVALIKNSTAKTSIFSTFKSDWVVDDILVVFYLSNFVSVFDY